MTEKNYLGLTRRPRAERYFYTAKTYPREWMESVLGMLEVVLDTPGQISLQDVADALDYGPKELSPRQRESFGKVVEAWDRSKTAAREKCGHGDHLFINGQCWWCDEPQLKVVDD